jgi:quinolinate synthase
MTLADIARIRRDAPGALVVVHGEVRPELQEAADAVLSTSQRIRYVAAHPERTRCAVFTERGLVVRRELDHPAMQFYKPCRLCHFMQANTRENVYETRRDEPPERRVTVPADVRAAAARAMRRMLELAA